MSPNKSWGVHVVFLFYFVQIKAAQLHSSYMSISNCSPLSSDEFAETNNTILNQSCVQGELILITSPLYLHIHKKAPTFRPDHQEQFSPIISLCLVNNKIAFILVIIICPRPRRRNVLCVTCDFYPLCLIIMLLNGRFPTRLIPLINICLDLPWWWPWWSKRWSSWECVHLFLFSA